MAKLKNRKKKVDMWKDWYMEPTHTVTSLKTTIQNEVEFLKDKHERIPEDMKRRHRESLSGARYAYRTKKARKDAQTKRMKDLSNSGNR